MKLSERLAERMSTLVSFLIFAFSSIFRSSCSIEADNFKLQPLDLFLIKGGTLRINCSLCPDSLERFNASELAFNLTLGSFPSSSGRRHSSSEEEEEDGNCNEELEPEKQSFETDNETDVCNTTRDDLEVDTEYLDENVRKILVDKRDVRIVNRSTAEFSFSPVGEEYDDGVVLCYLRSKPNVYKPAVIYVGEKPHLPVISEVVVRNWDRIEFSWRTTAVNKKYTTEYKAWYKNSTFEEFTECPLQPKTTPPPNSFLPHSKRKRCRRFCVIFVPLGFGRVPNSIFTFKVNGSNKVGNVTSEVRTVDLHDFLIPDPVGDASVTFTNFTTCVTFDSPKFGATFNYELLFICEYKHYETVVSASKVDFVRECVSNLPSYSVCTFSLRAKPYGYGNWSDWSNPVSFQTPERVPLAAPELCRSCFEVSEKSGKRRLKLYFKPLSHELARGKIRGYRLTVRGFNSYLKEYSIPPGAASTVEVEDLGFSSDYELSLAAATTIGYNESIIPALITVSLTSSNDLKRTIRNVTAFIVNSTTVRLLWSYRESVGDKSFVVFWCKGKSACQHPIHSVRVAPGADHEEVTILPAMDFSNYIYGVAVETVDGRSSGISWNHCLYNLSRVCEPPKLDKELIGDSLRLKFHMDNLCRGGYPYAFRLSYCPLGDRNDQCTDEPHVLVVNSSDNVYEFVRWPSTEKPFLFMVSSLTVAGPSLSTNTLVLDPSANRTNSLPGGAVAGLICAAVLVLVLGTLAYFIRRISNYSHITVTTPPSFERNLATGDTSGNSLMDNNYKRLNSNGQDSDYADLNSGSQVENGDVIHRVEPAGVSSTTTPLLRPVFLGFKGDSAQSVNDPDEPSQAAVNDSDGRETSSNAGANESSLRSVYRGAALVAKKQLPELSSHPVTNLQPQFDGNISERRSPDGNKSGGESFVSENSDYALGRPVETLPPAISRYSLDDVRGSVVSCGGTRSSSDYAVGILVPHKSDSNVIADAGVKVNSNNSDGVCSEEENGDYSSSEASDSDYTKTCMRDGRDEFEQLLKTPAADPVCPDATVICLL